MASCESDIFQSRPRDNLFISQACSMIPTPKIGSFDQYNPTTTVSVISQDQILHFSKRYSTTEPVTSRLFGSSFSQNGVPSAVSIPPMSRSSVGKTAQQQQQHQQHQHQHTQMGPSLASTQINYIPKKENDEGLSGSQAQPSITSPGYYAPTLTEPSVSNREGARGFQNPGYALGYPDADNPYHSAPHSGLGGFPPMGRAATNPPLAHHYSHDGRDGIDCGLYNQQGTMKIDQPMKIESSQDMSGNTWVYQHHQMPQYQSESAAGILPSHPHLPSQGPVVHLTLNSQNSTPPDNTSSRDQSPGSSSYTYQTSSSTALHSGHSSVYAGGGLSTSTSTSSFNENDVGSENRSPNHSPYIGTRSAIGPGATSVPIEHYHSSYAEPRTSGVQLLHCNQCTQRFASHEHFAKHQIKHQKLHRCRILGCSRVEGFTTPNDRDRHEKSVHKTPGMYFRCMDESCASYMKTFARRDNLKDHLKRMHKMPQEMDDAEANERRNELADSWRVDLTPGLTPPPGM